MPFHIQPIREFLVRPALPDSLNRMTELAYNLLWSWEPLVRALFRRLDPTLWRDCGYNPVLMLGRVSQATLQKAGNDPRYLSLYRSACEAYDARVRKAPAPPALGFARVRSERRRPSRQERRQSSPKRSAPEASRSPRRLAALPP